MEPGLCDVLFIVVTRRAQLRRSSLFLYIYIHIELFVVTLDLLFVCSRARNLTDGVEIWGNFFLNQIVACGLS